MQPTPKMRADARRNREALIAAAREVFAEEGAEAPLEEIAARAGVGAGTLYRHFPERGSLLLAIVEDRWERLLAEAERLAAESPGAALEEWLRGMVRDQVQVRGLVNQILECDARGCSDAPMARQCSATKDAMGTLLEASKQAGTVRADITAPELFDLMAGVIVASDRHDDPVTHSGRLLDVVLAGLRA